MKASIDYKTYREDDRISPSDIKLFGKDILAFHKSKILKLPIEQKKSTALIIGDIVDMILTKPQDIDKLYYIFTDWKATEKVKEIVDIFFERCPEEDKSTSELDDPNLTNILADAITEIGYYNTTWSMDKRKDVIIDKGKDYYQQLKEAHGREHVTQKTYNKAEQSVQRCRDNKDIQQFIWAVEGTLVPKDVIIKTQTAIYGSWMAIRIKGLLDVLWIDMHAKTCQMIEVKTVQYLQRFARSAHLSRYDVQVDMYQYLLEMALRNTNSKFHGFTLLPPKILVIPIEGEQQPEWFKFTDKDYQIARHGYDIAPGKHIFGWTESLSDIQWHKDKGKWEHHRSYYETNMVNVLDLWSSNLDLSDETILEEDLFDE